MEEHRGFKKKIIKVSFTFLGIMLGLTVLSKTIYTLLLPQATLVQISQGTVENKILATGKIGKDVIRIKGQKVAIKMPIDGSVVQCFAQENQSVKEGEPLFKLQIQVDENEIAEARYNEAEHRIIKKGLQERKEEKSNKIKALQQELAHKKVDIQKGIKTYKALEIEQKIKAEEEQMVLGKQLYLEGLIAEAEYKKGRQLLELLKKEKEETEKEEQEKRENNLDVLEEKLDALKCELSELEEKYALEESEFSCKVTSNKEVIVTSPIDGVLYERDLAVGANASKGEQLGVMIPNNVPITLSFKVNQGQADTIGLEQEVTWTLDSQNRQAIVTKKTYDETSDKTIITCKLPQEVIKDLKLGCKVYKTVDVEVVNKLGQYDLVVPNTALVREGGQTYVYTLEEIQTTFEVTYCVHKIPVTVIKEGDNKSAISGPLSDRQKVIKKASKPLSEGIEVTIQ